MTVKNLTLWLAIALTTLATTSCSDSSGSLFDGTEAMPINMNNLTGKWIAVFAVGTDANGQRVSESDMSGISTLDIVPLLILNSDNTFKAYSPAWKNNTDYVWAKGTTFFTTGEGSVMLIGSRLQLAQTAPKNAVACDIVSLTRTQLICQYAINGSNIQCTYQRTDIDVNAYDSDTQREPSLYVDGDNMSGTWLAVHVTGTDYSGDVNTSNMTGIDSLQVLPLIHINGGTFIVYSPHWQGDDQQQAGNENYTWEQGTALLPGGRGVISYNGNRLVLTETNSNARYSSPLAFTVVSLTRSTLICRYGDGTLYDLVCTYQRINSNL